MTKSGMKIGFIGLGIMGAPMALNLLKAGHMMFVQTRSKLPQDLVEGGATVCTSAEEVAKRADVVITMLPDTADVQEVLLGERGVAAGLKGAPLGSDGLPKLVIDMSSISPMATQKMAERIHALGAEHLDAPVSGGEVGAKAASLTIMVGGSEATFNKVQPLFALMGKNITLIGDNGSGQTCKVANQIVVALNIEAVGEALLFAAKAGADPAKVRQALMGGLATSRILELHGERMIKRTFNPGFRIELHQKDLNLALEGAKAMGLSLPNTASTQQLMSSCVANGGAGWDHSGLVRALEIAANFQISPTPTV